MLPHFIKNKVKTRAVKVLAEAYTASKEANQDKILKPLSSVLSAHYHLKNSRR